MSQPNPVGPFLGTKKKAIESAAGSLQKKIARVKEKNVLRYLPPLVCAGNPRKQVFWGSKNGT